MANQAGRSSSGPVEVCRGGRGKGKGGREGLHQSANNKTLPHIPLPVTVHDMHCSYARMNQHHAICACMHARTCKR